MRLKLSVPILLVLVGLASAIPVRAPSSIGPGAIQEANLRQPANPSLVQPTLTGKAANKPLMVWECVSSWYGEPFDGQPTATGEIYDMYALTAAHPTLPLGSIVRLTNPRNHRSLVVRINDRGPYVDGRDLDVSFAVAQQLGFDQRGEARLRLELLEVPTRPALVRTNN